MDPTERAALSVANDLTRTISRKERFSRLLRQLQRAVPFDAAAIFLLEDDCLVAEVALGLKADLYGRRLDPAEHPRLEEILRGDNVSVFDRDDPRPDPFDGMIDGSFRDNHGKVHDCMGARLALDDEVLGLIAIDSLEAGRFTDEHVERFGLFAALASAAVQMAERIEALERTTQRQRDVVSFMNDGVKLELIGSGPRMDRLRDEIAIVAGSDLSVLIVGETGTGKELVARSLHRASGRADKPMISVNCAALPETIVESELFGHVRGAFSGAIKDRVGRFELAEHGTIFLDEIGELPLSVQSKLLRTIQFGEVQRVGAERTHTVDVRIIAATNRDLQREVKEGRFREDLFHRLNVYPIEVPALRDHIDDIEEIAGYFLERYRSKLGTPPLRLCEESVSALKNHDWPGNVRELEHVLMRGALRATAASGTSTGWVVIDSRALGISPGRAVAICDQGLREATDEFQRRLIRQALDETDDNYAEAARLLEMDRSNLHRLAQRLGVK